MACALKTHEDEPRILVIGLDAESCPEVSWSGKYVFCEKPSNFKSYDLRRFSQVVLVNVGTEASEPILKSLRGPKANFVKLTDGRDGLLNWVTRNDFKTLAEHKQNTGPKLVVQNLTFSRPQSYEDNLRAEILRLKEQITRLRKKNLEIYQKKITLEKQLKEAVK